MKSLFVREVEINSQALSLFRILFALLLLFDLITNILPFWDFFYSAEGTLKASEMQSNLIWSLMQYSDHFAYQGLFFVLYTVVLIGFLVGYQTRVCAFAGFLLLRMITERSPVVNSNAETLEICLLLWSSFLPLDRYWSWAAATRSGTDRATKWPLIPVLAVKAQIAVIYFCSGAFKLANEQWREGLALTYSVHGTFYGSYWGGRLIDLFADWLIQYASWGIILFQIAFSLLVYVPLKSYRVRAAALILAALMHISFIVFLQIHMFPYLCLIYLVLLFPDQWINAWLHKRRKKRENIRIFYDSDCSFCRVTARLFKEFCLNPDTPVLPANQDAKANALLEKHNSWVVYGNDGDVYIRWQAVSYVLKQTPCFWIFGAFFDLPLIKTVMDGVYEQIGKNRHLLGAVSRPFFKTQADSYPDRTQLTICFLLTVVMVSYTIWALPQISNHKPVPLALGQAAYQTGVWQKWNIFVGGSPGRQNNIELTGVDLEGGKIPLDHLTKEIVDVYEGYFSSPSQRIIKYYGSMFVYNNARDRMGMARYLCWKSYRKGSELKGISMHFTSHSKFDPEEWQQDETSYFGCEEATGNYGR